MNILPKQYAESLYQCLEGISNKEINIIIENFVKVLKKNNDTNKLNRIIEQFCIIWNKKEGIVDAEIISAKKLDNEIIKSLNYYIFKLSGAKKVFVNQKVDKNILGGVIIKYEDKIFDGSLETKLVELKKDMIN